jgi:hypothetical protein
LSFDPDNSPFTSRFHDTMTIGDSLAPAR